MSLKHLFNMLEPKKKFASKANFFFSHVVVWLRFFKSANSVYMVFFPKS